MTMKRININTPQPIATNSHTYNSTFGSPLPLSFLTSLTNDETEITLIADDAEMVGSV